MKHLFLSAFFAFSLLFTYAQKEFNGTIEYELSYKNLPEEMAGMESMLPSSSVMYIQGDMTRMDQEVGMGGTMVVIANNKKKTSKIFMDAGVNKFKTEIPKEKVEEEEKKISQKQEIKYYDSETMEILGYTCKKAVIKTGEQETVVFYTDEIDASKARTEYNQLKGFPLYTEMDAQGMTIIMKAVNIDETAVDKSKFEDLEGYDEMPFEQFEKMTQGGGM